VNERGLKMENIIIIDLGTTGVKVALINKKGELIAHAYKTYSINAKNERIEQYPEEWWQSTINAISEISEKVKNINGIILSGQMQNLIALSKKGMQIPAILYSDTRARKEAIIIEQIIGQEELIRVTGNIQDASSLLAKLLWLRENEPDMYAQTDRILFGAHDFIAWKLTNNEFTDFTTLSTTGLLDIKNNNYAYSFIDALGIQRSLLPPLIHAGHLDGLVTRNAALATGLPEGTPVYHGSGDVGSTTIGAGAGMPGSISCYLGTSGWIAATTLENFADPKKGIYNLRHPDSIKVIKVGPMLMAAGNIEWAINVIGNTEKTTREKYKAFNDEVIASKSSKLIYLPYLVGERAPFKDPDARGAFIGIERSTTRGEMYKAILEGVTFAMRSIYEAMVTQDNLSIMSDSGLFSLSGGGAKSPIWPQLIADVFNRKVIVPKEAQLAGIWGAYIILGKELGWFSDYSLPGGLLKDYASFLPISENSKKYEGLYKIFLELYPALKKSFSSLAGIRTNI
jgi:xylulokinase